MSAPARVEPTQLTRTEARALTDRIKTRLEHTWGDLSEAYERGAWTALDFPTWESYVNTEFGISRSRSYQLLDQAKVVREIQAAAAVHIVDITEAAARDLKPHLAEVVEQVREAVADVPVPERPAVVAQVVTDVREQVIADRATGEVLPSLDRSSSNGSAGSDEWSPSSALDTKPTRPPGKRPSSPPRPSTIEEDFVEATRDLRRAADRIERLTADARFPSRARKLIDKHRPGIDNAVESLQIAVIRMDQVAGRGVKA